LLLSAPFNAVVVTPPWPDDFVCTAASLTDVDPVPSPELSAGLSQLLLHAAVNNEKPPIASAVTRLVFRTTVDITRRLDMRCLEIPLQVAPDSDGRTHITVA
jgi:hypothetical protein